MGGGRHGYAVRRRSLAVERPQPLPVRFLGLVILAALAVSAAVAWAVREEPDFYLRARYPLEYEHIIRVHASNHGLDPALVERLGEEILGADGAPDRERIAFRVFKDRDALDFLEKLLHPLVSREYLTWREQLAGLPNPPRVCVTEVPLLYEVGGEKRFDKVVLITAPSKLREARRGGKKDDREARLLPDREKAKRADFVYVNTGTPEELDAWVAGVMATLSEDPSP